MKTLKVKHPKADCMHVLLWSGGKLVCPIRSCPAYNKEVK